MSAGSAFFGRLMTGLGNPNLPADHAPRAALAYAGIGVLLGSLAILWLRLVPRLTEDYTPAKRGPLPEAGNPNEFQNGPLWVAVDYRVNSTQVDEFRALMRHLRHQRLRNGATAWHLHDANGSGAFTESFAFPTWSARLRHHERTTKADAALEDQVHALHTGEQTPAPRHTTTPPAGYAATSGCAWEIFKAGVSRELVCFFDRMDRARERDAFRFQPRPPMKVLPFRFKR
jgi:hypothetical protein